MKPLRIGAAILAFIALVTIVPFFEIPDFGTLSQTNALIAGFVPIAIVGTMIASQVSQKAATFVGAGSLLIVFLMISPMLFEFVSIGGDATDGGLSYLVRLAVPIVIMFYVVSMGIRRVTQ